MRTLRAATGADSVVECLTASCGCARVPHWAHCHLAGGVGWRFAAPPPLPAVSTEGATEVVFDAATLTGTVNPNGTEALSDTKWCFEYGVGSTGGYSLGSAPAVAQDAGSGTTLVPVNARLTGLSAGTTYRYRLVAVNDLEEGTSAKRVRATGRAAGGRRGRAVHDPDLHSSAAGRDGQREQCRTEHRDGHRHCRPGRVAYDIRVPVRCGHWLWRGNLRVGRQRDATGTIHAHAERSTAHDDLPLQAPRDQRRGYHLWCRPDIHNQCVPHRDTHNATHTAIAECTRGHVPNRATNHHDSPRP